MPDRAYANFWTREPSEDLMLDRLERLLETVPLSEERPGFGGLTIRAVDPAETPLAEFDLRSAVSGPPDITALSRPYLHADTQYEVAACWDLWQYQPDIELWKRSPAPILLICRGEAYDDAVAAQAGDFVADLGFEQLYTGDPEMLAIRNSRVPVEPQEAQIVALPKRPQQLHEYRDKIRQNIEQLFQWVRSVEKALPVERSQLWSEGEDNLEARLDEILAVH